ncbi:hypothetical protein quinque_009237 [Culex quinquefasciatus]
MHECLLKSDENIIECNPKIYQMQNTLLNNCGKYYPYHSRVANGQNTRYNEFPWMALLIDSSGNIICGGSLISARFVLTAAHCVYFRKVTMVRLGEYDTSTEQDCDDNSGECAGPVQELEVESVVHHALYSTSQRTNDIALVRLANPANTDESANVLPICLPFEGTDLRKFPDNAEMILSGWGHTEKNVASYELQKVSVSVQPADACSELSKLDDRDICGGEAHCIGDSGGPLQYLTDFRSREIMVQHGIVTFGGKTCGEGLPGSYLKVAYYMDWILEHMEL